MIGATLGSYKIISEIGSGGMGVVYLAEHTLIGRKAAVKLLRADMPQEYVDRFFNEAKAAALLHHPGLVDVFDFGQNKDGSAYIVMEFLHGESLAQRLDREPRLPLSLALSIARSVANALHVAHGEGIIHRDLKPANIFLIPDVEAPGGVRTKVLDFGIAKLMRDRDVRSVKTQSGAVIGTPRYMSPEQCKNARDVDGRADIYSLGCILYEMVLGVAPFDYDSWAELVGAHIYETPPKPTDIDPKLGVTVETLIAKMLAKTPDQRFQSMQELAQSLEVLLIAQGAVVRPTPPAGSRAVTSPQEPKKHDSSRDATMPASTGEPPAISPMADTYPTPRRAPSASPIVEPTPASTSRKLPWLAIAIGGAGLIAVAVAIAVTLRKETPPQAEPAYIVVNQREQDAGVIRAGEPPVEPVDAAIESAATTPVDAGTKRTPKSSTETDVDALTRTFAKQSPAITQCFRANAETREQVSVRIEIDTRGAVGGVDVLPASVGKSPLGACIADIARKTSFGAQPKPAAFRVPLHTFNR